MKSVHEQVNGERFWAKVDKSGDCWQWTAAILNGYGRFGVRRDGKKRIGLSHRIAYELSGRNIPDGMFLDHVCHNRSCVNPQHMRIVTTKQNTENHSGANINSKSGVRGVSWSKGSRKWRVQVTSNGRCRYGGLYTSLAEAEAVAIDMRNKFFTHNDIDRRVAA